MDRQEPKTTTAYDCYRRYKDSFFDQSNLLAVMREARDFYAGRQYKFNTQNDMPKPVMNICREYVEKVSAKILETPCRIEFVSDMEDNALNELDEYYEYLLKNIDNEDAVARMCQNALIDGTGVVITSFDKDTVGSETLFKGFLKRQVISFEDTFWDNPYCEDPQDQLYWGYTFEMEVGAVRDMVEGDEKTRKSKMELIVPDDFFDSSSSMSEEEYNAIDMKTCSVYVRFFRVDGDVFFEMSTKYCNIFEYPHSLNPKINGSIGKRLMKSFERNVKKQEMGEGEGLKDVIDYDMDYAKYTLFEKAVKETNGGRAKRKSKFSRYPVELLRLYPVTNRIYGQSSVSLLIANQKLINLIFLYISLIMQYHAMPKWVVKPDALKGQKITNAPNQMIVDYSPITTGTQWGVTRLGSGDAINSNLIAVGGEVITLTRNLGGFSDIVGDSSTNDTSGYALEQKIRQANITLEQPQRRLWRARESMARTDLMYLRHYVDKAKYFVRRSEGYMDLQNNYRDMAQGVVNMNASQNGTQPEALPPVKKTLVKEVDSKMFDHDFDVTVESEQGVASSEISRAQHYEKIYQYIFQSTIDADKIKAFIKNDPLFDRKTKQSICGSLDALEVSQLQVKNSQIQQLQQMVTQMQGQLTQAANSINMMNERVKAQQKGFQQATKEMQAVNASLMQGSSPTKSESEVKSDNAKGKEGGHFTV